MGQFGNQSLRRPRRKGIQFNPTAVVLATLGSGDSADNVMFGPTLSLLTTLKPRALSAMVPAATAPLATDAEECGLRPGLLARGKQCDILDIGQGHAIRGGEVVEPQILLHGSVDMGRGHNDPAV